jgi:hypothetical protein
MTLDERRCRDGEPLVGVSVDAEVEIGWWTQPRVLELSGSCRNAAIPRSGLSSACSATCTKLTPSSSLNVP